jgi:regulator of sirC expression with transglutaminase-like and TPR domain
MLSNLRGIYREQGQLPRLLSVLDRILLIDPEDVDTVRDRGLLRLQAGDLGGGVEDLEHYLETSPYAPEEEDLSSLVAAARSRLDRVH